MKPSKFVEQHFTEGVLKDLEENMIGLSEDVKDARDLLESLETEEALLQLLIDYTKMLREGSEATIDKTLQIVRQACSMGDILLHVQDFQEKVNAFKEKSKKLVQERAEQLKVETGVKSSPTSDLNWDATPKSDTKVPDALEEANRLLFKWAENNDEAAITKFCDAKMFPFEKLDYYSAWERATEIGHDEAQEVLEHYFGELIENRQFAEMTPEKESIPASKWEQFKRVVPGAERIIAGKFRESQISLAAMSAARIWGKTLEEKGKFSLRVFIDCLEQIVGPEVELDTDSAEQALKECSSVAHVSGDIWMEVN